MIHVWSKKLEKCFKIQQNYYGGFLIATYPIFSEYNNTIESQAVEYFGTQKLLWYNVYTFYFYPCDFVAKNGL